MNAAEILSEKVEPLLDLSDEPVATVPPTTSITVIETSKDEENEILKELDALNLDDVDVAVSECRPFAYHVGVET